MKEEPTVYAVDLDGTLSEEMNNWREYKDAPPIPDNIAKINELFENGNKIIIYTARHQEDLDVTMKWLKDNGVKFHKLVCGKLRADFYIDENSLRMENL